MPQRDLPLLGSVCRMLYRLSEEAAICANSNKFADVEEELLRSLNDILKLADQEAFTLQMSGPVFNTGSEAGAASLVGRSKNSMNSPALTSSRDRERSRERSFLAWDHARSTGSHSVMITRTFGFRPTISLITSGQVQRSPRLPLRAL